MGNISSRQAEISVDSFVLGLAHIIDSAFRRINRALSTFSSLFFSRIFGYDVVFVDTSSPASAALTRKESLVCGPGNVCIVPANRVQQRQLEKKRRSERRKRAEAAAMGDKLLHNHRYSIVNSVPNSPVREDVHASLGQVAKAPVARPAEERETVSERERGKLWVMGNVAASHRSQPKTEVRINRLASSPLSPERIDEHVLQRVQDQRWHVHSDSTMIKRQIQPRKSSRSTQPSLFSAARVETPSANRGGAKIAPVVETDETVAEGAFDSGHLTRRKQPLHAATVLPPGALSLGASPWQPTFRHPFSAEHEPWQMNTTVVMMSKPKQHMKQQQQRPKLSLDIQTGPATTPPFASPISVDDDADQSVTALQAGYTISRPPSAASSANHNRARASMARKSIDAISLRSIDSSHPNASAAIDVKLLATKAVKEERGRKVWKDHVNKAAMQRCLQQQHPEGGSGMGMGRRFSATTLAAGGVGGLARVKTNEADLLGTGAMRKPRRGSSPSLALQMPLTSGRSTPVLRAESPLHTISHCYQA